MESDNPVSQTAGLKDGSAGWTGSTALGPRRPFYQTAPNPHATRRMLLVFFDFAPSAEVGALRWLSLARFGAERGWAIDVVTLHPRFMSALDTSRLAQLPPGIRLYGFSGKEPGWYVGLVNLWRRTNRGTIGDSPRSALGARDSGEDTAGLAADDAPSWRRSLRSRLHFMLADGRAKRATALGIALSRSNRFDVVVSSGPPHAAHRAAREIAAQCGAPLIMDMRDPWSDESAMPEELRSRSWRRVARAHERRCVASADAVIVTSKAHEALQVEKFPMLRGRVHTVMNGADADPIPPTRIGHRFVIAFAGMIYLGRNPRALFRAAARVARETNATPEEFGVEFMGDDACEGVPLAIIAAEEGLGAHFRSYSFRPRREALEFLSGAALLVSLPLRTAMTLPAKLFEYVRFDAWVLALAEPGSATAELLRDTDADVVAPDDDDAIARVIESRFAAFRSGVRPTALNHDGRFDRATQAALLFDKIESMATRGR